MLKIKVCGLNNLDNLNQVASLKPDYLGLNFYKASKRFLGELPEEQLETGLSKRVGVFVDSAPEYIFDAIQRYKLSHVQLHGDESPAEASLIRNNLPGIKIIKAIGIRNIVDFDCLPDWEMAADFLFLILKVKNSGAVERSFAGRLKKVRISKPFFLAGGIAAGDCADIKDLSTKVDNFYGVDLNSRFESSAGIKDIDLLNRFFCELRS